MNITDQQKEVLAAEATNIFIQNPAWENFPKMLEISNIENAEHIFKGPPELMNNVFGVVHSLPFPFPSPSSSPMHYAALENN